MSLPYRKGNKVEEFWKLPVTALRAIAADKSVSTVEKRLATRVANQKEGKDKPATKKQIRARALNYARFSLLGMQGTIGRLPYACNLVESDLTKEQYILFCGLIAEAKNAITAALHYAERINKPEGERI